MTRSARTLLTSLALLGLAAPPAVDPVRADLVVDIRAVGNAILGKTDARIVCQLREDRAHIETRMTTVLLEEPTQPRLETSLILVRGDLGVSWVTEPDSSDNLYTEAPWPDTLTCPPSLLPANLPDSVAFAGPVESLDWTEEVARTAARDTIAGYLVEEIVVRAVGRPGERAAREHEPTLRGIPLRYRVTMEMPGWKDSAAVWDAATEQHLDPASDQDQLTRELFDAETGAVLMESYEVVSIRGEAVPDQRYELAASFKKVPRQTLWDSVSEAPERGPSR